MCVCIHVCVHTYGHKKPKHRMECCRYTSPWHAKLFSILHKNVCHCVLKEGWQNFINIKTWASHLVKLCRSHVWQNCTEDISKLIFSNTSWVTLHSLCEFYAFQSFQTSEQLVEEEQLKYMPWQMHEVCLFFCPVTQ